jgi:hypothetical protein
LDEAATGFDGTITAMWWLKAIDLSLFGAPR